MRPPSFQSPAGPYETVKFVRNPLATELGNHVEAFLAWMGGPTCFLLEGDDPTRTRALVTLLHGNEPSGVMALFRWLKSGQQPAVNVVCIVASVAAALEPPLFSHRMLPRARDLNRCFMPRTATLSNRTRPYD